MKEILRQRKFKTWDEAFRGLTPVMRQHSVRVADYTQVLFDGVCKSSAYITDRDTPVYMNEVYAEVAYKCGFYHQIGKALDPQRYPPWREDFTDEEKSRYCAYTVEGKELVARLQGERGGDISIPNKMIREACEFHMERWDGSGLPYGYAGKEISLIAQIVGLAKEMDRLICERKTENPFEETIDILLAEEDKAFSHNLIEVVREHQTELRNVYKKYIQYTRIMPKTIPLVDKRPERPFGLKYRQIVAGTDMSTFYFEAVPWFGGVLEKEKEGAAGEEKETYEEAEQLLMRTGLIKDISIYLLYEAADALARMKNCDLPTGGVLIPVFSEFFRGPDQSEQLAKFYEDTQIDSKKLVLTVPERLIREDRAVYPRLTEYIEQGVVLMVDDYHPEDIPVELLREIGFTHVRIAKDSNAFTEAKENVQELQRHGITVIDWPVGDGQLTEDELIQYLMKYE
ncbi:MAG: EAL domain-containing protein [Roseburia sp.]|nr:EAL domain-containing protein [Roseburia sp.]